MILRQRRKAVPTAEPWLERIKLRYEKSAGNGKGGRGDGLNWETSIGFEGRGGTKRN